MKFDVSYENMTIAQFILKYNIGMSVKKTVQVNLLTEIQLQVGTKIPNIIL